MPTTCNWPPNTAVLSQGVFILPNFLQGFCRPTLCSIYFVYWSCFQFKMTMIFIPKHCCIHFRSPPGEGGLPGYYIHLLWGYPKCAGKYGVHVFKGQVVVIVILYTGWLPTRICSKYRSLFDDRSWKRSEYGNRTQSKFCTQVSPWPVFIQNTGIYWGPYTKTVRTPEPYSKNTGDPVYNYGIILDPRKLCESLFGHTGWPYSCLRVPENYRIHYEYGEIRAIYFLYSRVFYAV